MLATKVLSAAALLVTTVLADGDAIVDALGTIASDTAELNNTVLDWDGGLLGTLPIITKSTALLSGINKATKTAKSSEELSLIEAVSVALATQDLIQDVNVTLATIVDAKPKFDHLLLSPVILLNLGLEKGATDKFSAAVKSKLPEEVADAADQLAAQIDEAFDDAIDAYDGPF